MARSSTSWKPGQSGNPKGAPKRGFSITEKMKEYLETKVKIGNKKYARWELAIARWYQLSMKGYATYMSKIWDHLDGSPVQKQLIANAEDQQPFIVKILGEKDGENEGNEREEGPEGPADNLSDDKEN